MTKLKLILSMCTALLISSCGDFPEYYYDDSEDLCMISFPFAGGVIGRQYIGYFRIISTLQYLDDDPTVKVVVTGPSTVTLDPGSFQKLVIDDQVFIPTFDKSYFEPQLQLWGAGFTFTAEDSKQIYRLVQEGNDLNFIGRIEIGHQYDTDVYNFFFDSAEEPFTACINRLLSAEEIESLNQDKSTQVKPSLK